MPVYFNTLVEFFDHVNRKSDPNVSRLCHGSSPIFEEFLSLSSENPSFEALKCFITDVYFVLITDSHVHTASVALSNESCNA